MHRVKEKVRRTFLLITPPLTQVNTPYPATAYLTQFLRQRGYQVEQADLGIELIDRLFSPTGLTQVREELLKNLKHISSDHPSIDFFVRNFYQYESTIAPVMKFLRGQDPSLALRIVQRNWLPESYRFEPINEHAEVVERFGELGVQDFAKFLASLYLDDLVDVVTHGIDSRFGFSRYAESLAASQVSFTPLFKQLKTKSSRRTLIDQWIEEDIRNKMQTIRPYAVGFSVPFPGNVYAALRGGQLIKMEFPGVPVLMGGGYVNTELRRLEDSRLFEFIDYLLFDSGEQSIESVLKHIQGELSREDLLRTAYMHEGRIVGLPISGQNSPIDKHRTATPSINFKSLCGPTYQGLPLQKYFSMLEFPNPMHRLWSDFRWNKMILAHGCYWRKCTFCDVSLDYIQRYEPAEAKTLVDIMERLIAETGQSGFHFVDEAAPPALLKAVAQELIRRQLGVTWWGNIRFDKAFTPDVVALLAESGCVAVSGGLEVASPRILKLIKKGLTLEQAAEVTKNFAEHNIMVHAYLMYGFPTQTATETIESLEAVRQLFLRGCIHSAHWHRFLATVHSPVGQNPEQYGIQLIPHQRPEHGFFSINEIGFIDPTNCDHDALGQSLRVAVYNYMHGIGLDDNVKKWFPQKLFAKKNLSDQMMI